jgi:F-type H+-transporting ATPase subunit b
VQKGRGRPPCLPKFARATTGGCPYNRGKDMLEINATVIIQVLNLIVFFIVLKTLLLKPILDLLDKRRKVIEGHIEEAEAVRDEVTGLKQTYRTKLEKLESDGDKILKEFTREGERIKDEHIKDGRGKAQQLVERSEKEIAKRKDELELEAKKISVNLALKLSEKLIMDSLDEKAHQEISKKLAEKVKTYNVG